MAQACAPSGAEKDAMKTPLDHLGPNAVIAHLGNLTDPTSKPSAAKPGERINNLSDLHTEVGTSHIVNQPSLTNWVSQLQRLARPRQGGDCVRMTPMKRMNSRTRGGRSSGRRGASSLIACRCKSSSTAPMLHAEPDMRLPP